VLQASPYLHVVVRYLCRRLTSPKAVFHTHYRRCNAYHHLFLALMVFRVLFHTTKGITARLVEKFVAHAAFLYLLSDVQREVKAQQGWALIYPFTMIVLWFAQSLFHTRAERLHACLSAFTWWRSRDCTCFWHGFNEICFDVPL
jgi:ABC-type multidrug transport system fused ATPase/permease subunit